jgi:DNA repair protein RecN (Recombination protein N)
VVTELAEVRGHRRERAQEADLLRLGLSEIGQVEPVEGEDVALQAEIARLAHADALRSAATSAHEVLVGDPDQPAGVDATGLVAGARQALSAALGHDSQLDALATRLGEVAYLMVDVAADLASYAASVDADPARLAETQDRLAALTGLTRKYADDLPGVLAWAEQASRRLGELDRDSDRLEELVATEQQLRAELSTLATRLTEARQTTGGRLAAAVDDELAALAMPDAHLEVQVTQRDDPDGLDVAGRKIGFGPTGTDTVEMLLVAHRGAPARPVAKGASGGELSRVMLAVEVVLAGADPVPTMVFDEVDAGVGGKAAVEVGRRLARLARDHQVIVVTHLPQVAAFADCHLHVAKTSDGVVTASGVTTLDDTGRLRELSRMLAGLDDSDLARGHAEELLAVAASAKAER